MLLDGSTAAGAVLILALVAGSGLALGSLRVRGIGLGIAGVLFAGLAFGHFGVHVDERTLEFAREFGLILFVYSIGLQVGPGFFASLRRHGLRLNLLAAAVVLLGVATALGLHLLGGIDAAAAAGILSGATTNTPSLAAAQQALKQIVADPAAREPLARLPSVGYAVAYPFGVFGIIVVMVGMRAAFRISLVREREELERGVQAELRRPARANLEVANPNLVGMPLERVPLLAQSGIVVSRIHHDGVLQVPRPDTTLALGDVLLAVGTREELDALRVVVGKESDLDLRSLPSAITTRRLIITRTAASGKTIGELDFLRRYGVQITRVSRAEVELPASPAFELQYGDTVLAVGEAADIARAASELGDSPKSLNYPHLLPMFVGIALGILLGSWAFSLPGVPAPVRLGLAGGPLLVAILLSRIGRIGPLVWYMPISPTTCCARSASCSSSRPSGCTRGTSSSTPCCTVPGSTGWRGRPRHRGPAGGGGRHRPGGAGPELPDPLRAPGREHDRPAGARVRERGGGQRGPVHGLRHGLPADDDPARPRRAALQPTMPDTAKCSTGRGKEDSPIPPST